jgi:hypothetical protein
MESGTITREDVTAGEPEVQGLAIPENQSKPEFRGYLSLVCMSALLEHDGEAQWAGLRSALADSGVASERARGTFKNSLRKTGKVVMDGEKWIATEAGVQFVAEHTDLIEESHEKVTEKMLKFSPVKYTLFKHIQESARPDGWLFDPAHEASALVILAGKFNFAHRTLSRNLYTYNQDGFTDQQRREDSAITNIRLNEKGTAELEKIKVGFPDEVAALEAMWTIKAMRAEIDNMYWELGEEPVEFTDIKDFGQDELDMEINRLAADMRGLMSHLDAQKAQTQVQ